MTINFIDRVKFFFRKEKELLSALYDILGFYPHNLEIFRTALAHKSQAYRNPSGVPLNNERLEFLGDAILEAVVSDIVFHRYDQKREGFLSNTRSKIVQRESLNRLAREIGLERLVRTTAGRNSHNSYIGGNAFEALIGAIYLDRGYALCKWFIEKRIIGRLLDIDSVAKTEVNFKSKLLEWTQKNRIAAEYRHEQTENAGSNNPVFSSIVVLEGIDAGRGKGHSKKESHQQAAKEALNRLHREPKFADSIFRAKAERAATEGGEACAKPGMQENDNATAAAGKRQGSRHSRRAPQPQATREDEKADAGPTQPADATATPTPKRRRSRSKKADAATDTGATATATTNSAQPATDAPAATADGESPTPRKPRRRGRRKKPDTADAAAPTDATPTDIRTAARPKNKPESRREDIIRQAEDAAFGTEA